MAEPTSASTTDPSPLHSTGLPAVTERLRVDWRSFSYIVIAVLSGLAVVAIIRNTNTMFTRIGLGTLIALALDPVARAIDRRLGGRRGIAVAVVALGVAGVAALVVGVLGPRAVEEIRTFSEQFPATVGELERLPLIGDWVAEQDLERRTEEWVAELPEQFTDARLADTARTLVTGVASVAIVAVVAISVLVDGENLVQRFRRLLPLDRRDQADEIGRVVYATLGRYFGGSLTVASMMGIYVLAIGLVLGVPLAPLAAIWAMFTSLIPQVGGFLGGSFFVLLAVTEGVTVGIAAAVLFVVYMNLENHVIQPAIVGRSVDLTPPTTMVAAFVGAAVAGVPGALVATPVVGAAKHLILEARGRRGPESIDKGGERAGLLSRVRLRIGRVLPAAKLKRQRDNE